MARPHKHTHSPLVAETISRLGVRVPPEVVQARLRTFEPKMAKALVKSVATIAAVFSLLAGPMIWGAAGPRLALIVVGGLFAMVPIAALASKRDAAKLTGKWWNLSWDHAVSLDDAHYGLVVLNREGLTIERPMQTYAPERLQSIHYDAAHRALQVTSEPYGGGKVARTQDTFSFKLPATVEDGQAEAIADVFHMVWACGAREPSQAAKAWLEKH